jgi:hypothetical protein
MVPAGSPSQCGIQISLTALPMVRLIQLVDLRSALALVIILHRIIVPDSEGRSRSPSRSPKLKRPWLGDPAGTGGALFAG